MSEESTTSTPGVKKPLVCGDIVVVAGNRVLKVHPVSGEITIITEGGDAGEAMGIAFDQQGRIVYAPMSGMVGYVDPVDGVQHLVAHANRLLTDVVVRPDGDYLVVNIPSATISGMFRIHLQTGDITQHNTGTNFGDAPTGIAIGRDGHYYVSHVGRVLRVDSGTGEESVVSDNANSHGIAVSGEGDLFLVGTGEADVVRMDPVSGAMTVVSNGGEISNPNSIAVEPEGTLLVADFSGEKLVRIDPATGQQSIVAQGGVLAGIACVDVFVPR